MTQRAPRWMWIVLIVLGIIPVLVGIAFMIPDEKSGDTKAAPAETRGCERSGGITTCSLVLPADGSMSEGVYASDSQGKLNWEATGPAGTLVCPDENPCVPLREGAEALKLLRFAREGGGEVTITLKKSN